MDVPGASPQSARTWLSYLSTFSLKKGKAHTVMCSDPVYHIYAPSPILLLYTFVHSFSQFSFYFPSIRESAARNLKILKVPVLIHSSNFLP